VVDHNLRIFINSNYMDYCKECGKLIGTGRTSKVYLSKKNKKIAIKVIPNKYYNSLELRYSKKADKLNIGPKIYKKIKTKTHVLIYMQKIDIILYQWLKKKHTKKEYEDAYKKVLRLIKKLHKNNIIHGDIHIGNIGLIGKKWVIFDFGKSHTDKNIKRYSYFDNLTRKIMKKPSYSNKYYEEYLKKIFQPYNKLPLSIKSHIKIIELRMKKISS